VVLPTPNKTHDASWETQTSDKISDVLRFPDEESLDKRFPIMESTIFLGVYSPSDIGRSVISYLYWNLNVQILPRVD